MNIFEDSFYSGFFGALMKDLQIAEREKRLKDAGVEIIDGVYGIPSKDIPFKFKKIIVSKDLIYCFIDEEFFAYDISGMFLFKAIKVEKIGDNFYLVQHKKDGGWALFKGNMKLTKPIFRYNIRARFEKDFSIIGLQKNFMDDVVINKKGKILYANKAFEKLTDFGIIINTSFNVRGEPIVCSPKDAYKCFMRTEMDYLVLGSFILDKKVQPEWKEEKNWREDYVLD